MSIEIVRQTGQSVSTAVAKTDVAHCEYFIYIITRGCVYLYQYTDTGTAVTVALFNDIFEARKVCALMNNYRQ